MKFARLGATTEYQRVAVLASGKPAQTVEVTEEPVSAVDEVNDHVGSRCPMTFRLHLLAKETNMDMLR